MRWGFDANLMNKALGNLTILDVSEHIAGAYCTKLLGGFGAEVIKVEKPGEGDPARKIGPFPGNQPHPEKSAVFLYLNTQKKSITLNLNRKTGKSIFERLVMDADVLVENFKPGEMANLGLDFTRLEKIQPALVMASITPFGQTGPYRNYAASSITSYAMGGQMYVCGQPEREPLFCSSFQPEYVAGLYGFVGIMAALHSAKQSGKGQYLDISIMECMNSSHQFTLTWPAYSGSLLKRPGWPGMKQTINVFRCKDGYIVLRIAVIEIGFLAELLNMPELNDDPRFQTDEKRLDHLSELEAIVARGIAQLNKKEIFLSAGEWREPGGYVAMPQDLLNDPQYRERDFWTDIHHPCTGRLTYPGAPFKMTKTPWIMDRAPLLGEHNQEIYGNRLGYSRKNLEAMRESGVI
jgi:CoA:oxalate CoA-transferase